VPFLSALEVLHDDALYESTRLLTYCILLTVSTKLDMEIAWYRGQSRVSLSDDARYRMDSDNCLYRFVILGVTVNDAGDWRCLATNAYGQCISACTVDVVGSCGLFIPRKQSERRDNVTQFHLAVKITAGDEIYHHHHPFIYPSIQCFSTKPRD